MASKAKQAPSKKSTKIFDESDSDSDNGGIALNGGDNGFKINEDYAKRFEYNKKREELQKCTFSKCSYYYNVVY